MISFEQLMIEHRDVTLGAAALDHMVRDAQPASVVAAAIAALDRTLGPHLATEDAAIYPLLLASGEEGQRITARRAIDCWSSLADDWAQFVARWPAAAIDADRAQLEAELASLLAALAGRVKAENDVLYPMALRAAHIRLRTPDALS